MTFISLKFNIMPIILFIVSLVVDDALGQGVNSTGPDHQYSESGSRRATVNPTHQCYTQYFVGYQPPTGFRPLNSQYIKHICQQISDDTNALYVTMFDEKIGIPVYVGYGLENDQVLRIGTFPRISKWFQESGYINVLCFTISRSTNVNKILIRFT